jgi:PucR family transcriptional regulator, proline-responsive transcriptional activator
MPRGDEQSPPAALDVQRELDGLAVALGRSVSLDDPGGTLLGYSIQGRDVDTARVEAILSRRVPQAVLAYQRSFGVDEATGPVRVPANPDLQMSARTGVPIQHRRDTIALLWVLEDGRPLDSDETRTARACGDRLRALLRPAELADPAQLLTCLFDGEPPPGLAEDLSRQAPQIRSQLLQFVVVAPRVLDGALRSAAPRLSASKAVVGGAQARGRRLVLVAHPTPTRRVADLVRDLLQGPRTQSPVLGHSAPFRLEATDTRGVATLAARAIVAADCAATDPALPVTTGWDDLGLYRQLLLTTRPQDWPGPQPVPDEGRSATMLRHTLEVYLDHAGDAARSIATLQIHRTTFYYRLERLTRLYGIDLDDGLARTSHHLSLKTRRLGAARDRYGWTSALLDRLQPAAATPLPEAGHKTSRKVGG